MWAEILKILKNVAILSIIITGLVTLGVITNTYIPWHWLTDLFGIFKFFLGLIDFTFDTTSLFIIYGINLIWDNAEWIWQGTLTIISWFKARL